MDSITPHESCEVVLSLFSSIGKSKISKLQEGIKFKPLRSLNCENFYRSRKDSATVAQNSKISAKFPRTENKALESPTNAFTNANKLFNSTSIRLHFQVKPTAVLPRSAKIEETLPLDDFNTSDQGKRSVSKKSKHKKDRSRSKDQASRDRSLANNSSILFPTITVSISRKSGQHIPGQAIKPCKSYLRKVSEKQKKIEQSQEEEKSILRAKSPSYKRSSQGTSKVMRSISMKKVRFSRDHSVRLFDKEEERESSEYSMQEFEVFNKPVAAGSFRSLKKKSLWLL